MSPNFQCADLYTKLKLNVHFWRSGLIDIKVLYEVSYNYKVLYEMSYRL